METTINQIVRYFELELEFWLLEARDALEALEAYEPPLNEDFLGN